MVKDSGIWNQCIHTTLLQDTLILEMGEPGELIDLPVAMKAVSDRPGTHDQDFLASCIIFSYLLAGQRLTAWLF